MRPDDLVEFSRQSYGSRSSLDAWDNEEANAYGLNPLEEELLNHVPQSGGRALLLGVGAGREVGPLADRNYEITAVDFVAELLEKASENSARRGVKLGILEQEISKLEAPAGHFDLVWLSSGMYSCVPTSGRRVEMARRIRKCLKPGGYFVFGFVLGKTNKLRTIPQMLRTAFAYLTLGNLTFEPGDTLWHNSEFIHVFSSGDEVESELRQAGFDPVVINADLWGGAVFHKPYPARERADAIRREGRLHQ
jgi:SAM-dependent methyltransferase